MKAKRIILYIGILLFFCSCDRTQQLQKIANETMLTMSDYLPYHQHDTIVFENKGGKQIVFTIDSTLLYDNCIPNEKITNISNDRWFCFNHLSLVYEDKASVIFNFDGVEGNLDEYYLMVACSFVNDKTFRYSKSMKTNETIPDILRLIVKSKGEESYAIMTRHKGLTEFSLDGQEIWRLVERE